jgi:hypothetical protein
VSHHGREQEEMNATKVVDVQCFQKLLKITLIRVERRVGGGGKTLSEGVRVALTLKKAR